MSAAAIVFMLGTMPALAQTRSGPMVPAELPPASFTGTQYVDSQGCVFMRAGFNGRVNWVPRYGNDRRPMCGMQPTLAGGSAPSTQPRAAAPVAIAAAAPARTRAPAPQYVAPAPQIVQAQALDRRWSFADRVGPSPCTHMTPHSQMYMVPSPARPDLPIRCGPQAEHPADALRSQSPNNGQWVPWNGSPGVMEPNVYQLPPTYAPRWPDAHLAPQHAPQGHAAPVMHHASAAAAPRTHVSTQGAAAPRPAAAGHRYVQVGSFGVPQNAQATAARLQAQGLPVAMTQQRLRGQVVQVVMAGPFGSAGEVSAALGTARAMGFSDAFTRN